MNERSRIVYLNTMAAFWGAVLQILLSFVLRKLFISTLGVSYLGYNSVFVNVLQLLNLADLGIGVAITSFLYKPLAENDRKRVAALMWIYKRIYMLIGTLVIVIGVIISIFIEILIPDSTVSVGYLRLLFFIHLLGTVSTYFLAYKRTLIIADQKSYLANIIDTISFLIISVTQIICLLFYADYVIYLLLSVAKNIASNIILSAKCRKIYGRLYEDLDCSLVNQYKPQIIQYVKDVFVSRIGAVVFYGTDNVIISMFRGSLLVGFLSNYTMITGYLSAVVNKVFSSIQATYGNYIRSGYDLKDQKEMTDNYLCANFLIGNYCMICFAMIVQPFVQLYFGQQLLLSFSTAIWLGINLMLSMLIQLPSQVFIIYRLFKYDRLIILVSAALNIIISVIFVKAIGIDGALIGTFVTSLIYLFSRFYIIAKRVYYIPYFDYIKRIFIYFFIAVLSFAIVYYACNRIEVESWPKLIVKAIIISALAVLVPSTMLSLTKEFRFLTNKLFPTSIARLCTPWMIGSLAVPVIIVAILLWGGIEKVPGT